MGFIQIRTILTFLSTRETTIKADSDFAGSLNYSKADMVYFCVFVPITYYNFLQHSFIKALFVMF